MQDKSKASLPKVRSIKSREQPYTQSKHSFLRKSHTNASNPQLDINRSSQLSHSVNRLPHNTIPASSHNQHSASPDYNQLLETAQTIIISDNTNAYHQEP